MSETPDTPAKPETTAEPDQAAKAEVSAQAEVPVIADQTEPSSAGETPANSEPAAASEKAAPAPAADIPAKAEKAPSPESAVAKAEVQDKPAASEKAAPAPAADKPAKAEKAPSPEPAAAKPSKVAKADSTDKPAKPAKPAAKQKPEDKPFAEFIQEDLLPALTKSLTERESAPISLALVEGERPVVGGQCWMVQGELPAGRRFWLCFASDAITSGKTIALAESGSDPSLLESFLIDEKRINQALLESRLLQRLNGQKWFGGN